MIYADHAACAPVLPPVAAAVAAALTAGWGNPSARQHPAGRAARAAIDNARDAVAGLLRVRNEEIVFTSGATEACNLALLGCAQRLIAAGRPRILAPTTEHAAVLGALEHLKKQGAEVDLLPVDATGRLDPQVVAERCDGRTGLVCAMLVNNETGTIHDLPVLAEIAHRAGALLFTDLAQAPLRLAVDLPALGADLAAFSGPKLHGPPGTGGLWLRRGLGLDPRTHGGGQERGLRAGTENAPALAGLAVAIATACTPDVRRHLADLDARLLRGLDALPGLRLHRAGIHAPGIVMITAPGRRQPLLGSLPGIAASAGASCSAGRPSHVLAALGLGAAEAKTAVRLSLGASSTVADVDGLLAALARVC